MNIPFPVTTPRFIDSKWFCADNPCDEDAELTALEQSNQQWVIQFILNFVNLLTANDGENPLAKIPFDRYSVEYLGLVTFVVCETWRSKGYRPVST